MKSFHRNLTEVVDLFTTKISCESYKFPYSVGGHPGEGRIFRASCETTYQLILYLEGSENFNEYLNWYLREKLTFFLHSCHNKYLILPLKMFYQEFYVLVTK